MDKHDRTTEIIGYLGLGLFAATFPVWVPVICDCILWVGQ
jgi:hypothetical protein